MFRLFSFIFLMTITPTAAVLAADIRFEPDAVTGCNLHLDGEIQKGDKDKIKKLYARHITGNKSTLDYYGTWIGARLCLNSPGGSIAEAFRIFEFFTGKDSENETANVFTYVPKNSICESACSIIFMGGGDGYYGSAPTRAIHPMAKLGFHSPALDIKDGLYSEETVSKAYGVALKTISELLKIRRSALGQSVLFPSSVIETMLNTAPEDMYYIETVGDAARWGISVFPVALPEKLVGENWLAACWNSYGTTSDVFPDDPFSYDWSKLKLIQEYEGAYPEVPNEGPPFEFHMGEGNRCTISLSNLHRHKLYFRHITENSVAFDYIYPEFLFYGAMTKLSNLPVSNDILGDGRDNRFKELLPSQLTCGIDGSKLRVDNVQNFTNFRQQPGLRSNVIGKISLGEVVTAVVPGRYLRTERCASACEGTEQEAINRCIDNNEVWIEVRYNGSRGYLSRKFLTEIK